MPAAGLPLVRYFLGAMRDESGFLRSALRNKEDELSAWLPRDRRINTLSGGIIFPKWPFIKRAAIS
jgi:hypothetical protein